jgi:hypothetical protein
MLIDVLLRLLDQRGEPQQNHRLNKRVPDGRETPSAGWPQGARLDQRTVRAEGREILEPAAPGYTK